MVYLLRESPFDSHGHCLMPVKSPTFSGTHSTLLPPPFQQHLTLRRCRPTPQPPRLLTPHSRQQTIHPHRTPLTDRPSHIHLPLESGVGQEQPLQPPVQPLITRPAIGVRLPPLPGHHRRRHIQITTQPAALLPSPEPRHHLIPTTRHHPPPRRYFF